MIERDVVLSAMSFFFIHVKTGVIFGFIKDAKNEFRMKLVFYITKAGDGNRTHVSSLEGWCSTIELHPHEIYEIEYCLAETVVSALMPSSGIEPETRGFSVLCSTN